MAGFSSPEELATTIAEGCESPDAAVAFCAEALALLEKRRDAFEAEAAEKAARVAGGGWGESVTERPGFMVYGFLKTPPPIKPRSDEEGAEPCYPCDSDAPQLHGPPSGADVLMEIHDRYGEYRAYIAKDGEAYMSCWCCSYGKVDVPDVIFLCVLSPFTA